MIAKRVSGKKGASDFKKLVRYIGDEKGQGGKVREIWATNCATPDDIGLAMIEVAATQLLNTRSENDKTYHLVISLAEGEDLTTGQWGEVENAFCEAIGFGEHQRVCAIHTDTHYKHMHVAISKVHPSKLTCVEPYYDKLKLLEVCRELEKVYGLKPGIGVGQKIQRTSEIEVHRGLESFAGYIREHLGEGLIALVENGGTWKKAQDLCGRYGVEIRERGAGLVFSHRDQKILVKVSSVDRKLSKANMEKGLGTFERSTFAGFSEKSYVMAPTSKHPQAKVLYAKYQSLKEAELVQYRRSLQPIISSRAERIKEIKERYAARRLEIKKDTLIAKGKKRVIYQKISQEMKKELDSVFQMSGNERKKSREMLKIKSWKEWLWEQATLGDEEALGVLRSKTPKILDKGVGSFVGDFTHSKIFSGLKRRVMKDGMVEYQTASGGIILDNGREIVVKTFDPLAINVSISIAKTIFRDSFNVKGSDQFKNICSELLSQKEVIKRKEKKKNIES